MKASRITRSSLKAVLLRYARGLARELRRPLSRRELADLGWDAREALAVAAEFNAIYPRAKPLSGDELVPLVAVRAQVQYRLRNACVTYRKGEGRK